MFVYPSSVCVRSFSYTRADRRPEPYRMARHNLSSMFRKKGPPTQENMCAIIYFTAPKPPTRASAIQGSRAARDHARHNAKLCTQTHDTHNTAARSHAQAPPHLEIVLSHAHTTAHLVPSTSALLFLFPAHAHGTPTRATRVSACAGPVPVATPRIALPCEDESKVSKGYESAMRR